MPSVMDKIIKDRQRGQKSPSGSPVGKTISLTTAMPPSVNNLYVMRRGGRGKALTKEAKDYRESVKRIVSARLPELSRFPTGAEEMYEIDITIYFKEVENQGWYQRYSRGEKAGERKAQSRYKRLDYDNRIKFLQDSIVKSIGIPDDSQIFNAIQRKRADPGNPRVDVVITVVDPVTVLGEHHGD